MGDGYTTTGYNNGNWDTAYGWGNHASVGYITSFTNTNEFVSGATFNSSNGIVTFTRNNGGDTFTVDIDGRFSLSAHNHDGDYIQDGGSSAIGDINTIGTESIKHRWNTSTVGRPASSQSNEYGTVTTLTYDSLWATQIAWDIHDSNLYGRTLDVTNNTGTWSKFFTDSNFTDNSNNWNTAYGWGDHAQRRVYLTSADGGHAADTEKLLDGLDSTQFLRSDASDTHTATLTVNGQFIFNSSTNSSYREGIRLNVSTSGWGGGVFGGVRDSISGITDAWWVARNPSKDFVISYGTSANSGGLYLPHNSSALEYKNNRIWNESDFANNSGNWNTAYGWGNHASGGYLTSYNNEFVTGATFNSGNGIVTFRCY